MMMLLSSNPSAMRHFRLPKLLKILGWMSVLVMAAATIGMFATWGAS
jgi:Mn2+/Fe2+ NRAMP family transporter